MTPPPRPSRAPRISVLRGLLLAASCAACASGGPAAGPPASAATVPTPAPAEATEDAGARLDAYLTPLAAYGWGGAVWIHAPGSEPVARAYGLADRERGTQMSPQSAFDIGSLTKPFTAAAILKLEEDGLLSVEDSLGRFVDDVPVDKRGITLGHLLTHTAGLVRSAQSLGVDEATDRDTFVRMVLDAPLLYDPGERFEYSDTGYDLLAAIVEIVTKEDFAAFLSEAVLAPAGLTATAYLSDDRARSLPVAPSYTAPFGVPWLEEREGPSEPTWFNLGSGGLLSTAPDLGRWLDALLDGRILREETVRRMISPQVVREAGSAYGYGWFIEDGPEGREIWHGGDIGGYKAHLGWNAASGVRVAVLDNVFGFERVADRYIPRILRGDPVTPPPAVDPDAAAGTALSSLEGVYRFPDGGFVVVWMEGGRVVVEAEGDGAAASVFGVASDDRSGDARAVVDALLAGDAEPIDDRLRERDRAAGMTARLASIWGRLAERGGAVEAYQVLGTVPAQDGTSVSIVRVERSRGEDLLRIVWRGDRLVAIGGPEGLRRPTALFEPTGEGTAAARFEASTGETTRLSVREGCACIEFQGPLGAAVGLRDASSDIAPARSPLRELLPVFAARGVGAGLARLDTLSRSSGPGGIDEGVLNDLGYRLLSIGAIEEAIAVFDRVVTEHPDSWNAHDSLGEALLRAGREAEARKSYARSLELNPDNETAKRIIEEAGDAGP